MSQDTAQVRCVHLMRNYAYLSMQHQVPRLNARTNTDSALGLHADTDHVFPSLVTWQSVGLSNGQNTTELGCNGSYIVCIDIINDCSTNSRPHNLHDKKLSRGRFVPYFQVHATQSPSAMHSCGKWFHHPCIFQRRNSPELIHDGSKTRLHICFDRLWNTAQGSGLPTADAVITVIVSWLAACYFYCERSSIHRDQPRVHATWRKKDPIFRRQFEILATDVHCKLRVR